MKEESEARKPWKKPQLIIIARSKPEESVLLACKQNGPGDFGPTAEEYYCHEWAAGCDACSVESAS